MNKEKLFQHMVQNRGKNVAFADFTSVMEAFGFRLDRINGSHHIFIHEQRKQLISAQPDGKDAKPYQVRQFLTMIERFNVNWEE